jgi:hypothetical protein
MDKLILQGEDYAFDGQDMKDLTENKYNIYRYHELEKFDNIDQVLGKNLGAIILYQSTQNDGHWCVLWRKGNTIYFFDSYGFDIDEELKYSEFHMRRHKGVETPHLSHLIDVSGYKVVSSPYKLQKMRDKTNTCGRYAGARIKHRDLTHKEFADLLMTNKHYPPDFWIVVMTQNYGEQWNDT